ncbi:MAG: class I SAM-dependent methyltransferase [Cytophagales bacterium]|nr:MAG: class I SAM-dependent methyltransferase [Cytophagales bacterium]
MDIKHASTFVDPYEQNNLNFFVFKEEENVVKDGIFVHFPSNNLYPVIDGVPVFIKNRVLISFWETYKKELLAIIPNEEIIKIQLIKRIGNFSFSNEWGAAHKDNVTTVWGHSLIERLKIHYTDTESSEEELGGQLLLDVGCGNGILCKSLAEKGATVFGIDYSTSVWNAQKVMHHTNVCYIQADLHFLPFKDSTFDVVYSNGVLHHTADTENAFQKVAKMVKSGGKYYVWLYSRSTSIGFNIFLYITDAMRFVTNKLPHFAQKIIIEKLLFCKILYCKMRGKQYEIGDIRTDLYDTLTPTYKYYHTVEETQDWFTKCGFNKPRKTHLNNYGFGVLGNKN